MWNGVTGGSIPRDQLTITSPAITFYTQTNLTRGQTYIFSVAAINTIGTGPSSSLLTLVAS
jgi:hypothetical protein